MHFLIHLFTTTEDISPSSLAVWFPGAILGIHTGITEPGGLSDPPTTTDIQRRRNTATRRILLA